MNSPHFPALERLALEARLNRTGLENPCELGSPDYRQWRIGWLSGALGDDINPCRDTLSPAALEGYEAGTDYRKSITG